MQTRRNKTKIAAIVLLGTLGFQSACGTLLYPERRGQTSGRIDPAVAILNGIGLLFFLIPGLIAFAVDFSTGAIYLPPGEEGDALKVQLDPEDLTPERIAAVIREHTGAEVTLTEEDLRVMRLDDDETIAMKLHAMKNDSSH